jgi:hypothetical protein
LFLDCFIHFTKEKNDIDWKWVKEKKNGQVGENELSVCVCVCVSSPNQKRGMENSSHKKLFDNVNKRPKFSHIYCMYILFSYVSEQTRGSKTSTNWRCGKSNHSMGI